MAEIEIRKHYNGSFIMRRFLTIVIPSLLGLNLLAPEARRNGDTRWVTAVTV